MAVAVETEGESAFKLAWRQAQTLAISELVPDAYKKKPENCMIAMEVANRIGTSAFLVMQNSHIVHGKLGWSSSFIIGAINASGRFSPLRFEMTGAGDTRECFAWAKDLSDGERLEGPSVSIQMAKDEGWLGKKGSKWKTMPELMLRYRAAAFFGRLYAPEITLGLHAAEEREDIAAASTTQAPDAAAAIDGLKDVTPTTEPSGELEDGSGNYPVGDPATHVDANDTEWENQK